jgi:hypothetical protein
MSFESAGVPTRLYRLSRNSDLERLTEWRFMANREPGRWDDPQHEYRVLYTADSEIGAYVEVLQDLRPSPGAEKMLAAISDDGQFGEAIPGVVSAAYERLRQYYFGALIPTHPHEDIIVDVAASESRTELEARLKDDLGGRRLKIGDFSAYDYALTRRVSRCLYTAATTDDRRFAGLMSASAEHRGTSCFTYFETGRETNELRGRLTVHFTRQALDEDEHVRAAIAYLTH